MKETMKDVDKALKEEEKREEKLAKEVSKDLNKRDYEEKHMNASEDEKVEDSTVKKIISAEDKAMIEEENHCCHKK